MTETIVRVRNLFKTYRAYTRPFDRLLEALIRKPRHRAFHALENISFEIPRGEGLAVIGENGAGKSTLLKILSGVTAPSSGQIHVDGQKASILELGSAFHPEFTGRQNIALNAAMLGLSREEIAARTPDILKFSELGNYIEQPVKTYSTGMAMRLAFAIATQVEPDVLIIDEALSVGDGYFQKKCMDHITGFVRNGGTILFCSHAMYYVSAFCNRALWLRGGRIEALGPVERVVASYENYLLKRKTEEEPVAEETGISPGKLRDIRLLTGSVYAHGSELALEISWTSEDPDLSFHVGVGINRADEVEVASFLSRDAGRKPWSGKNSYHCRLVIPEIPLLKGVFKIYVFLLAQDCLHVYDTRIIPDAFKIEKEDYVFGLFSIPHRWED